MYGDRCRYSLISQISFFPNNIFLFSRYDHTRPKPQLIFSSTEPTIGSFQQDYVSDVPESYTQTDNEGNIYIYLSD